MPFTPADLRAAIARSRVPNYHIAAAANINPIRFSRLVNGRPSLLHSPPEFYRPVNRRRSNDDEEGHTSQAAEERVREGAKKGRVLRSVERWHSLAAAKLYINLGWPVFPVYSVDAKGQCTCGTPNCPNAGKHPATPHGLKDATTNLAKIDGCSET